MGIHCSTISTVSPNDHRAVSFDAPSSRFGRSDRVSPEHAGEIPATPNSRNLLGGERRSSLQGPTPQRRLSVPREDATRDILAGLEASDLFVSPALHMGPEAGRSAQITPSPGRGSVSSVAVCTGGPETLKQFGGKVLMARDSSQSLSMDHLGVEGRRARYTTAQNLE